MRASSKRLRVESSGVAPPPPSSIGDTIAEESVDPTVAATPPSTSNDSDIQRMLETVMTIQAAHGRLLVDMLAQLQSLRANLASIRQSPPPPSFDDK